MSRRLTLLSLTTVAASILIAPLLGISAKAEEVKAPAHNHEAGEAHSEPMPDAVKEMVKVTDHGLVPPVVTFKKLDSSVFFVNTTKDSLVSLSVNFGDLPAHCASSNMKFESGVFRSIAPIGPQDFAILCFPERGTYDVKVGGLGTKGGEIIGKVVVQ